MKIKTTNSRHAPQIRGAAVPLHTRGYLAASQKTFALFPSGHAAEIYRNPMGDIQIEWLPNRPDFTKRKARQLILAHYSTAIHAFTEAFGRGGRIINGA